MNQSTERGIYEISCQIFGGTRTFLKQLPSSNQLNNHFVLLVINAILIFPTILLNTVSIVTIVKSSQLKNKLCYCIILLQSVTDLAVGVFGIPLFIIFLLAGMGKIPNCVLATLAYRSSVLPIGVSMLTLSALTLERYIAVLHPYAYGTQVTTKRILIYVCPSIVVMFLVNILTLAVQGLIRTFTITLATTFFTFTTFVYVRIYVVVRKLARFRKITQDSTVVNNLTRTKMYFSEIKQAKNCFMVVICFFLLYFLPILVTFSQVGKLDKYKLQTIQNWATTLGMSNSSINSVIFFWTKTMLRKEAMKMMKATWLFTLTHLFK